MVGSSGSDSVMRGVLRIAAVAVRRGERASMAMMLVVIALATAGIAAAVSVAGGAEARLDGAFARANGPDLVAITDLDHGAEVAATLRTDPNVADSAPAVGGRDADMVVDATRTIEHLVAIAGDVPHALGAPVVRTGRMPSGANEIALDAGLAQNRDIGLGDRVSFAATENGSNADVEFVVVGTGYDFRDCFFPTCDPARSWVTNDGMAQLGGPTLAIVDVSLTDAALGPAVERRLAAAFGDDAVGVNTWLDTRGDLLTETDFFAAFLGVFGVFVLVASGVVIAAALTARTVARRRRIGLYKALGGTPAQITTALVVEHLAVALAAGLLGWAAATVLAPHLAVGSLRVIGTDGATFEPANLLLTLVVASCIVTVVTVVPAWRAGRLSAVAALRDTPAVRRRPSRLLGAVATHLPSPVELGARSWIRRPFRTATAIVALILAIVAGIVSISINDAMDHLLAHPEHTGDPWDVAVTPVFDPAADSGDRARFEEWLDGRADVASWYSVLDSRATIDGDRVHMRLLGGDPTAAGYDIGDGRGLRRAGEAIVGYGLLDERGWQVGDTVDLDVELTGGEHTERVVIVGWYRDTEDDGQIIQIRQSDGLGVDATPTYALSAAPGVDAGQLADSVRSLGPVTVGQVELNESDGSELQPFRLAMALMSALIASVALAHLFATALASARLRAHDRAVLRAVGVTNGQITAGTLTSTALSALCALAIGLPVGWFVQGLLGDAITSAIGVGPGASPEPPLSVVSTFAATLVILAAFVEITAVALVRRDRGSQLVRAD
jgi:putative ABC transport system permease protein